MKLMTKEIAAALPRLGATDGQDDRPVIVKYFTPWSNWTWWVFEGERQPDGDVLMFALVDRFERELGYVSLRELESVRGPGGIGIERDMHLPPTTYRELKDRERV
jgi:hypothetical protein